jgi:hypothetical protein
VRAKRVRSAHRLPLTTHRFLLAISLALIAACHGATQSEQEKLQQELKSWDATARLTRELSHQGSLPRVYVRQVSEAVEQGKQKLQQQAAKSGR